MPLEKIGRYQIIAELGKGAMGVVYKATDPNIGRTIALKTLRLDVHGAEPQDLLRRFKNEARAAGALSHPGIVTIYDAGEHEGLFYIAMELIEGQTLSDLLRREKVLAVSKVTNIIRQVCAGLDYAHARGIIHRDIKPANIMIQTDGTAKIMDFGVAKLGGTGMTSTGQVVGTPNYMSPEAVKGRTVDGRSDLFSVGVILYEMLTGERPFTGESVTTIIYKIVNETPAAPRDLDSSVHPGLSTVVMKALAKNPEQRYRTGAEFARDLQNYSLLATDTATNIVAPLSDTPPAPLTPSLAPSSPGSITSSGASAAAAPATSSPRSTAPALPAASTPVSAPGKPVLAMGIAAVVIMVTLGIGVYVRKHRQPAPPPVAPAPAEAQSAPETKTESAEAANPSDAAPPEPEPAPPPQPARPTPVFGDLQITSTPAGAAVTIDGRSNPNWKTPFAAARLKPGRHSLAFSLEGYQPEKRQVEVAAGKKLPLDVTLQSLKAFVSVNSTPAGAQIFLDGHDSGQLTPSRITVSPGKHRIAVRKEGYKEQVTEGTVAAGAVLEFSPAMPIAAAPAANTAAAQPDNAPAAQQQQQQRSSNPFRKIGRFFKGGGDEGVLDVRTNPAGAEIWLGEKKAPSKSPAKLSLAPGVYTLTLRLAGHKPITRSITVEKGKTLGLDETFQKQ